MKNFRIALLALAFKTSLASGTEGFWLPDQAPKHSGPIPMTAEYARKILASVVKIGKCTGSFVGDNGLILTQQHCAYQPLQEHSTLERNLNKLGYLAKTPAEELVSDGELSVTLTRSVQDVSQDILKDLPGKTVAEKLAEVDKRMKSREEACKNRSASCRVVETAPGTEYIEVEEEEFKDVRLVFTPSRAMGFANQDPFYLKWGSEAAPFAIFRVYKDGKPFQNSSHLAYSPKVPMQKGETIAVAGYTNIYKRYHWADDIFMLYENGLMRPSSEWLSLYVPYMQKRMKQNLDVHFKYERTMQALGEWKDRIDGTEDEYRAMKFQNKFDLEREFVSQHSRDPEFQAAYKKMQEMVYLLTHTLRHENRFDNFFSTRSMNLIRKLVDKKTDGAPMSQTRLEKKKQSLDPEAELHALLYAFEVLRKYPYPVAFNDQLNRLTTAPLAEREKLLRNLLKTSFLFKPGALPNLEHDPLVELYTALVKLQENYSDKAYRVTAREAEFVLFPHLAAFLKSRNRPFYPAIGNILPGLTFGKIRSFVGQTSLAHPAHFEADIDACFRNLRGAPAFNAAGEWIGFYAGLAIRGHYDINFYYDPSGYDAIHVSLGKISDTLEKSGASALLLEIKK